MGDKDEPRELTPVQMFWDPKTGFKDFGPHIEKVQPDDRKEVEDAITPVPKDESALASAALSGSQLNSAQTELVTPVPTPAGKESGKPSESSGDAATPTPPTSPSPESSSQDSSSEDQTKSGSAAPPAPVVPPLPSAPTPQK